MSGWAVQAGFAVGAAVTNVTIDEHGNLRAEGTGDPRGAAAALRVLADDVEAQA